MNFVGLLNFDSLQDIYSYLYVYNIMMCRISKDHSTAGDLEWIQASNVIDYNVQ